MDTSVVAGEFERKQAKRAIVAAQKARGFARLAQILHCAKGACSG